MHTVTRSFCRVPQKCFAVLGVILLTVYATACGLPDGAPDLLAPDPEAIYWRMQLNHRAATLSIHAPWDTVTLKAVPLTYTGDTLPTDSTVVQFSSSDSNAVSVNSQGLVRAKQVVDRVMVTTRLTWGALTYTDTTYIRVVDNPSPKTLQALTIHPNLPDSAKLCSNCDYGFSLASFLKRPASEGGDMTEVLVDYYSLDPRQASFDRRTGMLEPHGSSLRRVGQVVVIASAYAYGVSHADTLLVQIGYPTLLNVTILERAMIHSEGFEPYVQEGNVYTLGVGGEVLFINSSKGNLNLVFADTTHISNVWDPNESVDRVLAGYESEEIYYYTYCCASRRFTAPGTYHYRLEPSGITGTIHVIDEREIVP